MAIIFNATSEAYLAQFKFKFFQISSGYNGSNILRVQQSGFDSTQNRDRDLETSIRRERGKQKSV